MSDRPLFLAWNYHSRRAETLSAEMCGQVSFQYEKRFKGPWFAPLRYFIQGWNTWRFLEYVQPTTVIVQAPPIFAPLVVAIWCMLHNRTRSARYRKRYIIDCLTGSFHYPKWRWSLPLLRILAQRAVVILVTDQAAMKILQDWQVKGIFLVDGIPTLCSPTGTIGTEGNLRVATVGSLMSDEPVAEVFGAARLLPQVTFYLCGNYQYLNPGLLDQKPENIILTGFLHAGAYTALLNNVHGLLVLTKSRHAMNCGIYEALATGKPTIVSDWPQLRSYFHSGFIYVDNTPQAIASAVTKMLDEQGSLIPQIISMRSALIAKRQSELEELVSLLEEGS